jgi:hypothetical protein
VDTMDNDAPAHPADVAAAAYAADVAAHPAENKAAKERLGQQPARIERFRKRQATRRNWIALSEAVDGLARRDYGTRALLPYEDPTRLDAALRRIRAAVAAGAFNGWLLWLPHNDWFGFVSSVEAEEIGRREIQEFRAIVPNMWTSRDMMAALFAKEEFYTPEWLVSPPDAARFESPADKTPSPVAADSLPSHARPVAKELRGKSGPKDIYDWDGDIQCRVIELMDIHGEFDRDQYWYQAKLISLVQDGLAEDGKAVPDESGMKRRIPKLVDMWRTHRRTNTHLIRT